MIYFVLSVLSLFALLSCYFWDRLDDYKNSLAKALGFFFALSMLFLALIAISYRTTL